MVDLEYDRLHVWHPYSSAVSPGPVLGVRGAEGPWLLLDDGRRVLDGMSSWWSAIHGYRVPELDAAVRGQLERMAHVMFGGLTHEPGVELARLLLRLLPEQSRVFYADSGSVALEVALKMAIQWQAGCGRSGRRRMLTVLGGYHGDTWHDMSVCDPEQGMHRLYGEQLPRQLFAPRPASRFDGPWEERDIEAIRALLEAHQEEVAAIVLEPIVQGAGGMWMYHPELLRRLRRLADEYDVLLLFDEVATGFGRTGRLFARDWAGVTPDIMAVGKALTGGYLTFAATLCTERVALGIEGPLMHGPTFMGNALACAVSLASVGRLLSRAWGQRVAAVERCLRSGLAELRDEAGVADVRVLGAIGVVELERPVDLAMATRAAVQAGVWLRPFGRLVYTMPPFLAVEDDHVALLCRGIREAVRKGRQQ